MNDTEKHVKWLNAQAVEAEAINKRIVGMIPAISEDLTGANGLRDAADHMEKLQQELDEVKREIFDMGDSLLEWESQNEDPRNKLDDAFIAAINSFHLKD